MFLSGIREKADRAAEYSSYLARYRAELHSIDSSSAAAEQRSSCDLSSLFVIEDIWSAGEKLQIDASCVKQSLEKCFLWAHS